MPLVTRSPLLEPPREVIPEATAGEKFRAMAGDALYGENTGLLGSAIRIEELNLAEGLAGDGTDTGAYSPYGGAPARRLRPLSPILTPESARQRLRDSGVGENLSVPETGIREEVLDILIERKIAKMRRDSIMARGGAGWMPGIAGALAGSLVDPTNIALAFVPVVGEARYAALLARAGGAVGRTGVRVGVGAAEGVVGAALVEPLNYYANLQQQADYSAYDSMLNIAGGAVFGAALHAGAGLLGDAMMPGKWNQLPPPPRVDPTAGVVEVAPVLNPATGRVETPPARQFEAITPEQRERLIVMERLREGKPVTRMQAEALVRADTPEFRAEVDAELAARASKVPPPGAVAAAKQALADAKRELGPLNGRRAELAKKLNKLPGTTKRSVEYDALSARKPVLEKTIADAEALIAGNKSAVEAQAALAKLRKDGTIPDEFHAAGREALDFVESLSDATRRALDTDPLMPVRPFIAGLHPRTQAAALRMAVAQAADGRPIDVMPAIFTDGGVNAPKLAMDSAAANARLMDGASPEAAARADAVEPDKGEVEELEAMFADEKRLVDRLYAAAGREVDQVDEKAMAAIEADEALNRKVADRAALCLLEGKS